MDIIYLDSRKACEIDLINFTFRSSAGVFNCILYESWQLFLVLAQHIYHVKGNVAEAEKILNVCQVMGI